MDRAYWFSLMVEADWRPGLDEVRDAGPPPPRYTRFVRNYQVVARNHDEALEIVLGFARRMGESQPAVREFVGEEPIEDTHTGLYEVEAESFVFADDR